MVAHLVLVQPDSFFGGGGGTPTGGGSAGPPNGSAGSKLQGGAGGASNGGPGTPAEGGGGGGGGWYGGGGGGYHISGTAEAGGGGGGSSYALSSHPAISTPITNTSAAGGYNSTGGTGDPNYVPGTGAAGVPNAAIGGNGRIIFIYGPPLNPTANTTSFTYNGSEQSITI